MSNNPFNETEHLVECTKEEFCRFVKLNSLTREQGTWFHSFNFVDYDGNIKAYIETSSYTPKVTYKIIGGDSNFEMTSFVTKILNI